MSIHIISDGYDYVKSARRDSIRESDVSVSVSDGNLKYKPNAHVKFLIWSIPAQSTCPFSTAHCREKCYAMKAQKQYPNVRESRKENLRACFSPNFVDAMTAIILTKAKRSRKDRIIVRIHESGDFFAEWYLDKWLQIARNCLADVRVVFWTYTKSFQFLVGKEIPENFRVRGSVWDDTDDDQLALIEELEMPIYTAVEKFADNDGYAHCQCKDCANCETPCGDMSIMKTACEIH